MKRILPLFLVLLLMLPAGCKKQPTETASPGEVVEKEETGTSDTVVKKEETNISDESPSEPVKQPEEAPAVEEVPEQKPSSEDDVDSSTTITNTGFYVCKYLIRLKDENLGKEYTASSFSEIDCSQIEVFSRTSIVQGSLPRSYILLAKTDDSSKIFKWEEELSKRSDLEQAYILSYMVFQETEKVENLSLASVSAEIPSSYSVIQLLVKSSYYPDYMVSTKDFSGDTIDALEVANCDLEDAFYIDLYINNTNQIDVEAMIAILQKRDDVIKASLVTGLEYPDEKEA